MELSTGAKHYLVTALWSTSCFEEDGCEFLDQKYSVENISEAFQEQAEKDWISFLDKAAHLFTPSELEDLEQIGHDFWLTRNRHGAGFWDGDYENGDAITELVHKHFPENDDDLREALA